MRWNNNMGKGCGLKVREGWKSRAQHGLRQGFDALHEDDLGGVGGIEAVEEGEFVRVVVNELALMDGDVLTGVVGEEGGVLGAVGGFFLGEGGGGRVVGLGFGEGNGRFEQGGDGEVAAVG